jgi:hypothetical protein
MSTLAEINETLITQNTVLGLLGNEQTRTTKGIARLNQYMEAQADALREAESEARAAGNDTPASAPAKGAGTDGSGIFDKMGFLKGILGKAAIGALLGSVAVMLADEIGNAISSITGSDIFGSLAEYGLVGAGLGSIFGVKGAMYGALIMTAVGVSEKIAGEVENYFKENEIPGATIAGEVASALSLAATGALAGFAMGGPAGAIIGGLIGLTGSALGSVIDYLGNEETQKAIDADLAELGAIVNDISNTVNSWLEENITKPLLSFADNVAVSFGASTSQDRTAENVQAIDAEIAAVEQQISNMRAEAQALKSEAASISLTGLQGAERAAARQQANELRDQADQINVAANKLSQEELNMSTGRLILERAATIEANQQAREATAAAEPTNYNEQLAQQPNTTTPMLATRGLGGLTSGAVIADMQAAEATNNAAPAVNVGRIGDEVTNLQSTTLAGESRPSTANSSTPESYTQVVN